MDALEDAESEDPHLHDLALETMFLRARNRE